MIVFFGSFLAGTLYFGLSGIAWTDSIFINANEVEEVEEDIEEPDEVKNQMIEFAN